VRIALNPNGQLYRLGDSAMDIGRLVFKLISSLLVLIDFELGELVGFVQTGIQNVAYLEGLARELLALG